MIDNTPKTDILLDYERKEAENRREEISIVVQKIEEILISIDCNWQEWHNIIQMFNERNEVVIPKITIKEIKQRYNEQHK